MAMTGETRSFRYLDLRTALSAFGVSLAAALVVSVIMYLLSYVSVVSVSREHVNQVLTRSFEQGQFANNLVLPLAPDAPFSSMSGNDCLIYAMMAMPYPGNLQEAISPHLLLQHLSQTPGIRSDELWTCGLARVTAAGQSVEPDGYYHRYLHGFRTVMRFMLGFTDVAGIQHILFVLLMTATALTAFAGVRRWLKLRGTAAATRPAAYTAIAVSLLLFYGYTLFGFWPSYALADLVTIGFVAAALRWPLSERSERWALGMAAVFGCLVAHFEFLTGGLLIGACLVIGVAAIEYRGDSKRAVRTAFWMLGAFGAAVIFSFVIKFILIALVFGTDEIARFNETLGHRVSGSILNELSPYLAERFRAVGIDPVVADKSLPLRIAMMALSLIHATKFMAYGSSALGVGLVVLSVLVLAFHLIRLARAGFGNSADWLLLASIVPLPIWYLVFINHSILHASWMARPLVWLVSASAALTVTWLLSRRVRSAG